MTFKYFPDAVSYVIQGVRYDNGRDNGRRGIRAAIFREISLRRPRDYAPCVGTATRSVWASRDVESAWRPRGPIDLRMARS